MLWNETKETRPCERNADGTIHLTRTIKVSGSISREAILNRPAEIIRTLPVGQPGDSQFLRFNDLSKNSIDVPNLEAEGDPVKLWAYDMSVSPPGAEDAIIVVEIRYSNDIRLLSKLQGPQLNPFVPKGRAGAFVVSDDVIPTAQKSLRLAPNSSIPVVQWSRFDDPQPVGMQRRSYSLLKKNDPISIGVFRGLIQDEIYSVHRAVYTEGAQPEFLLFQGGDYSYFSPDFVLFTLFWLFDPGILTLPTPPPDFAYPPQDKTWPGSSDEWVRPPYHRLIYTPVLPEGDGPPLPSSWSARPNYRKYNPSGLGLLIDMEYP